MMPHYRLSPSSLLRLMLCALAGVSVQSASALPADPLPRIVVQPDGSTKKLSTFRFVQFRFYEG